MALRLERFAPLQVERPLFQCSSGIPQKNLFSLSTSFDCETIRYVLPCVPSSDLAAGANQALQGMLENKLAEIPIYHFCSSVPSMIHYEASWTCSGTWRRAFTMDDSPAAELCTFPGWLKSLPQRGNKNHIGRNSPSQQQFPTCWLASNDTTKLGMYSTETECLPQVPWSHNFKESNRCSRIITEYHNKYRPVVIKRVLILKQVSPA